MSFLQDKTSERKGEGREMKNRQTNRRGCLGGREREREMVWERCELERQEGKGRVEGQREGKKPEQKEAKRKAEHKERRWAREKPEGG